MALDKLAVLELLRPVLSHRIKMIRVDGIDPVNKMYIELLNNNGCIGYGSKILSPLPVSEFSYPGMLGTLIDTINNKTMTDINITSIVSEVINKSGMTISEMIDVIFDV